MNWTSFEELLLFYKAGLFDLASLLGIAGLILFIFNIRYEHRAIAWTSVSLMALSLSAALSLFCVENHYLEIARQRHTISPYYLSGYYCGQ